MISVDEREEIRRAYHIEQRSRRWIEREIGYSRRAVNKALAEAESAGYKQREAREAPVLGPYKAQIDALLAESKRMPRKQRYTGHKIYEAIHAAGYRGSESGVHMYLWRWRRENKRPEVFVPLGFDPGQDAQVDWGEAIVEMNSERETVQFIEVRLNYSRKVFVRAYPGQKQEAFFEGQVAAFQYFGGVPHRLSYDNLTSAVQKVLQGRARREQRRFTTFRSHYLFEANFCTPGEGHEKGGVDGSARDRICATESVCAVDPGQELRRLERTIVEPVPTTGCPPGARPIGDHRGGVCAGTSHFVAVVSTCLCLLCLCRSDTQRVWTGDLRDESVFGAGATGAQTARVARLPISGGDPG
jgi:transposase